MKIACANKIKKIIHWISKSNIFLYSISICIVAFCARLPVHVLKYIFNIPDIQFRERIADENTKITIDLLLNALILAPILETLVFQTFFYTIFKKIKINKWIIVLVSGISFGAFHNFSIFYMIDTALVGVIFMYFYILRAEYNKKPIASTIIAHATINLFVLIAICISKIFLILVKKRLSVSEQPFY